MMKRFRSGSALLLAALLWATAAHPWSFGVCGDSRDDKNGIKVIVSGGAGAPMVPFQKHGFYRVDMTGKGIREKFIRVKPAPSPGR